MGKEGTIKGVSSVLAELHMVEAHVHSLDQLIVRDGFADCSGIFFGKVILKHFL